MAAPAGQAAPAAKTQAAPAGQAPARTPAGARRHSVFHPLRVASIDRLTEDAVAVTFDVPPELRAAFAFQPGQHVSIRSPVVGDDVRRNYSICSAATSGRLRIGVKRIPDGVFSSYVAEHLRPGDCLDIMTPTGSFSTALDPGQRKRYAAIAAGSGITPVLSILATALEVEPASSAVLVYVNRTINSIMFLEELEDLKNRYPDRFQLVHVLDEEPLDVEILSGRLDAGRLNRILDVLVLPDDVDEWFLCGPLPMTDVAREVLLAHGAGEERIHRELFFVGPPPAAGRPGPGPRAGTGIRRFGHRHARRPLAELRASRRRRLDPRGHPPVPGRRPLRLQERGVRHLPGQGRRGPGADGCQLRPGARRYRRRIRPGLPVAPGRRTRRPRLRPVTVRHAC